MAKTPVPNAIVQVGSALPPELARFAEGDTSLDVLSQYQVVPRVKIIQAMTRESLKEAFPEGSAIITPGNASLGVPSEKDKKQGTPWKFVPLFFFADWITWADIKDTANFILGQSSDEKSEIARKSRDKNSREEPYGADKKFKCKHREHLNFIGFVYDGPLKGTLTAISFAGGEHSAGESAINTIKLRRAPLFLNVMVCRTQFRVRGTNKWWGIDMMNPPEGEQRFIDAKEGELFKAQHEELKKQYNEKKLGVSHDDEEKEESNPEVAPPPVAV